MNDKKILKEKYEELDLIIRDMENLIEKLKDEANKKYFTEVKTEFEIEFEEVENEYYGIENNEEEYSEAQLEQWKKEQDELEREYIRSVL